ncbi:MAG: sugar phosphate isomerase/epimerase [Oscillospiraceae bacterium]|nr:sugar phosphate isomerase/epimerase [Oscillospiraceae bacterium]
MATKKVGLQIYSIRDIYFKNPIEAFKLIKDCGYDAVDMFGNITMGAEELKKILDDLGLECCGWHTPWDYAGRPDMLEMFASYNKVIGNKYLIIPGLPGSYMKNSGTWLDAAKKINEIAVQLKKHGMFTGMHSHEGEFKPTEGSTDLPWDILAKNTTDDVVLQLDMGNTYQAGVEPVAVLKKYPGRAQTVHIKPYSKTRGMSAPIGEDDIDWVETVKFCNEKGKTEYFIVEYEEEDAKSGIKACIDNFRKYL